ncbi:YggS family pyridoxal phosphate enzyme [Actinoplanes lobatus]|uniref:Pyridoxal phosphate homeostasis protein n=1 Tax=Actinoplanes lobatus TaxID=113568 RepID=A0A7W7HF90_9ACTN|nr:YggS family pyridoxal phosphate-dependent enzyme [Actinoplanes lobatus]MBB4749473.1 pyridoxal phosphate enzyme (YggS family) [Actinoplanes lobatus]GGN77540.1 YggS family pyridoxal phosphate enzyme [Actinoplanes lobatus]GIE38210.1 YggS family pyridoxal phosphate enzyme [Actinoplanes lobatus]
MTDPGRRAELAASLEQVRERIARACVAAGRPPGAVTLTAVTKTYPASDVLLLAGLGVTDMAENRDQEAAAKAAEVNAAGVHPRWHFVGQLQRNKVRSVIRYADVVESVDSLRLADAMAKAAVGREIPLEVLVQVSLDADPARGGVTEDDLWRVSDAVASAEGLRLGGVMAVAPLGEDPGAAFARLAVIAGRMASEHPGATTVSAGMSGDLEAAVRHGATHVRIGTSLLGMRNSLR